MDSRSLNPRASEETLISLLQLDPTPMEPDTEKDLPPLPEESMESSTTSLQHTSTTPLGLSGSGHGAIYYLTRIQKYSTFALSIFTSIHLANTSIIPLITQSVPGSETYMILAREIYQTPLTEPLLVGIPIIAHIASGIALRLLRRSQNLRRYGGSTPGMYALYRSRTEKTSHSSSSLNSSSWGSMGRIWPPLSYISMSGYAFAAFLFAHIGVNRVLPLKVEGDSSNIGLGYVAHGFVRHGLTAWVAYVGLLGIGCGHMVWGAAKWLGIAPTAMGWSGSGSRVLDKKIRKRRRRTWWGIHGVAVIFAGLWAAGGLGVVGRGGLTDGWVGKLYDGLYARLPF